MNRKVKNAGEIIKRGDLLVKKAQKAAKSSWIKSPDWDDAAYNYRAAVKEYKKAGEAGNEVLLATLIESANAHEKCGSINKAAQNMELAGKLCRKDPEKAKLSFEYYSSASNYYSTNDQFDKAAGLKVTASSILGEKDLDSAMQSLHEAFQIFDDQKRVITGSDTMQKAISIALKHKRFDDGVKMFKHLNRMYMETEEPEKRSSDIYKNLLSIIVIRFHTFEYTVVEEEYKDAEACMLFTSSSEGEAAENMFSAYRAKDASAWEEAMDNKVFNYLSNQVSRIAKKMALSEEITKDGPTPWDDRDDVLGDGEKKQKEKDGDGSDSDGLR